MKWGSYLALLIILFIDFLGMIILMSRSIQFYIFELFLVVLFLLLAIIIMVGIYKNKRWSWKVSSLFFLFFLIVLSFMYLNSRGILVFGGSSILAALGFIISVANIETERELAPPPPPGEEEPEPEVKVEKEVKVVPYGKKVTKKFVAGKRGKIYYKTNSKEAKRVKNPVWFDTEAEAKKKGYKPHSSLK